MHLSNFILALLALVFVGCATTSPKSAKPYEFCVCGPTTDAEGAPFCAIWGDSRNPAQSAKVWASEPRPACEPTDCGQLFSTVCQKIQMSNLKRPTRPAPSTSCYCDAVLLENDKGQVQLSCAAWAEGSKNLIEYYSLDECSPQRCATAPFVLAAKVCNNNFKAFYPPLLNKR